MNRYSAQPGWYPDGDGWERWWDGSGWTAHRRQAETGPVQPPAPPPGPGPGGAGRRPWWPWAVLVLALVVVVGVGVALAVVRPWEGEEAGGTAVAEPAPVVTGDQDGDGLGDVVLTLFAPGDGTTELLGTSNGRGFDLRAEEIDSAVAFANRWADWDGDGLEEQLSWSYDDGSGTLAFRTTDTDGPAPDPVTLSFAADGRDADAALIPGDFDGDGATDLLVEGPQGRLDELWVMVGGGDGTFADPVLWGALPNAAVNYTLLTPGDFDGDGDDDIFAEVPAETLTDANHSYEDYYSGADGYRQITSTGTSFEVGDVVEPTDFAWAYVAFDPGTGPDLVAGLGHNAGSGEIIVTTYELADGRLAARPGPVLRDPAGELRVTAATASDVDGDGDDDLVYVAKDLDTQELGEIVVLLGEDGALQAGTGWGRLPQCRTDSCYVWFE
ncbi:FG-GAP-like repeat-containing protein [Nocardioides sp. YIM 152588]|uniref:FG-GAP-like repeat-containing protein n=1 Tax=Nocardioides sp. YIM 152588 TaxID=3158259 RepID=UPI0032E4CB9D